MTQLTACLGASVFLGVVSLAQGLYLVPGHRSQLGLDPRSLATDKTMKKLQKRILLRFKHLDRDGDGTVSWSELKRGFDHEPAEVGEAILNRMLSDCTGSTDGSGSCTRGAMEKSLAAWMSSNKSRAEVAWLETGSSSGFGRVIDEARHGDRCGPSAEARPPKAFEGVSCTWQGARCWSQSRMTAWLQKGVCKSSACICEGTKETKRLAKVGLMGAVGVTSAKNFTDKGDTLLTPACGSGWKTRKIAGYLGHIKSKMDWRDKLEFEVSAPHMTSNVAEIDRVRDSDDDYTEVALYKSAEHHIIKGGKPSKICMMSWQATRSAGDWKTNLMTADTDFRYAPRQSKMMAAKGLVLAYESTREDLKKAFEEECCSPSFTADKIVISGHSHGGAMAELNAVDAVTNWECPHGRDLGAEDLVVVLAAPHSSMLSMSTIDQIFSCTDPAVCLSGSVVTLSTRGDLVGDADSSDLDSGTPRHPSTVALLPCPEMPPAAVIPGEEEHSTKWWCHGIFNYVGAVETELVGKQGWGSSCGGECGDPNRLVQCNQYVLLQGEGCAYANASLLKPQTPCPNSRWLAEEERCDCHFDACNDLTTLHCKS